ncbi:MAG: glutaredoxin 3 [Pseudomonadota bacterium]
MADITVYSKTWCPYCNAARGLLQHKGVEFTLIDIGQVPERRDEMIARADGRSTVPQIFIGDTHIGGYDDLEALERAGKLDSLLADATTDADHNSNSNSTENPHHD